MAFTSSRRRRARDRCALLDVGVNLERLWIGHQRARRLARTFARGSPSMSSPPARDALDASCRRPPPARLRDRPAAVRDRMIAACRATRGMARSPLSTAWAVSEASRLSSRALIHADVQLRAAQFLVLVVAGHWCLRRPSGRPPRPPTAPAAATSLGRTRGPTGARRRGGSADGAVGDGRRPAFGVVLYWSTLAAGGWAPLSMARCSSGPAKRCRRCYPRTRRRWRHPASPISIFGQRRSTLAQFKNVKHCRSEAGSPPSVAPGSCRQLLGSSRRVGAR